METTACGSWKSMLDNSVKADIVNVNTVMDAYAQKREPRSASELAMSLMRGRTTSLALTGRTP